MEIKLKKLTLITLLVTGLPFISFTSLSAAEALTDAFTEDGSDIHLDDGTLMDGDDPLNMSDLSPDQMEAVAKFEKDNNMTLKNESITREQRNVINKAISEADDSASITAARIKKIQDSFSDTGGDAPPSDLNVAQGSTAAGGAPEGGDPLLGDDGPLAGDDGGKAPSETTAQARARKAQEAQQNIDDYNSLRQTKKALTAQRSSIEKDIKLEEKSLNRLRKEGKNPSTDTLDNMKQRLEEVNGRLDGVDGVGGIDSEIDAVADRMVRSGSPEEMRALRDSGRNVRVIDRVSDAWDDFGNWADRKGDWVERRFNSKTKLDKIKARDEQLQGQIDDATDELNELRSKQPPDEIAIAEKEDEIARLQKARRQNATRIRRFTRGAKWFGREVVRGVRMLVSGFAMLLAQALAFTVPSALYQMTVAKEDRLALLETISDVQPFGKLWLQIPPQLIDQQNPVGSEYLYCEVPTNNKQSGGYFNSQFLKTANFYVAGAPQPSFWGTSYIGGSQFNGQMVCLNNGFVFVGNGQPANYQQPTQPMVSVIEPFASGFVTKASANTFTHTADALDWLRMDASSLMAAGSKNSFRDPIIKAMLLSPMVRQYAATGSGSTQPEDLPGTAGGNLPPPMFYKTIAAFRSPTAVQGFGTLQLRQMEGTGFLNIILDNALDTDEPGLSSALKNLYTSDQNYQASINFRGNKVSYGQQELHALKEAQSQVAAAVGAQQIDTPDYGFSPDGNLNAYNIYVYEIVSDNTQAKTATTLTPALCGLLRNRPNSYIPLKEYVVCLGRDGSTIVPLLIPQVVKGNIESQSSSVKGSASISGYTVEMVPNPDITYISSLTTGITYQQGSDQGTQTETDTTGMQVSNVKLLTPYLDGNGNPDTSFATLALQKIESQLSQAGEIGQGALNQIVAMANYTTDAATDGPFTTYNGYTLTRVPLTELLDGNAFEQQEDAIRDMGNVLSNASSASQENAAYSTWSDQQKKEYLSRFYVYKVTKGNSGVLGKNGIPDYVVAVGGASSGKFEILPLGIDQMTGSLGAHGVQGLFSLITGRGYNADYSPLPLWYTVNMHPLNRGSYFPLRGEGKYGYQSGVWPGEQEDQIYVVKNEQGQQTRVPITVRVIPDVYMGTAFMPGYYNPSNRIITNPELAKKYNEAADAVVYYGLEFTKATASLQGLSTGTKEYAFKIMDQYGVKSTQYLQAAGFNEEQISALQSATNLDSIESALVQAQSDYKNLNTLVNTTRGVTTWKNGELVLNVPPLYFLFFTGFSFCADGGQSVTISPTGQEQGSSDASTQQSQGIQNKTVRWSMMQPCQNATSLVISHDTGNVNGSLMSVLPEAFSGFNLAQDLSGTAQEGPLKQARYFKGVTGKSRSGKPGVFYPSILASYTEWALYEDRNDYWVQNGFMGPFNFTQRQYGNVYITATSTTDIANGNFFYHASGFSPTDIFVFATGPADGKVNSIDQLSGIGRPYTDVVAGKYLINVGTGQVYTPYINPGGDPTAPMEKVAPYACFTGSLSGNQCSLQPVGQNVLPGGPNPTSGQVPSPARTGTQIRFSPQEVLAAALTNQTDIGETVTLKNVNVAFQKLPEGLQRELNTALQTAQQQVQKSLYPVYFGGLKLRLSQQSINNGTYIYAVTPNGEAYDQANDYVVVTDMPNSSALGAQAVTPYTQSMLSLVTGTLYPLHGASIQNFLALEYEQQGVTREQGVANYAMELLQTQNKVRINTELAERILDLNSEHLKETNALNNARSVLQNAPVIPIAAMSQAKNVTEPTLNNVNMPVSALVQIGNKYFLKTQSSTQDSGKTLELYTFFDFNATNDNVDSNVGVRYVTPSDSKAENLVPTSAVTGFELEAMRAAHGVVVAPNGEESLTIPVTNIPLPVEKGKNLVPNFGADGVYMKLVKNIPPKTNSEKGEKYYYYYHRVTQAYYVLVQDLTGTLYGGGAEGGKDIADIGYFVDLMSGDEYYVNGQPRMIPTIVAYPIAEGQNKQPVVNVEMPLFVWGEANNSSEGQNLNVLANTGQGYTQYMYVPFSSVYRFKNAQKQTMYIGYEQQGEGAAQQVVPMQEIFQPGSDKGQMKELNIPSTINTQGMTGEQKAEVAFTTAIEEASTNGWELFEIEYKVSPSGLAYNATSLTVAVGDKPRQYQFGTQRYVEGGIKGFNYPLKEDNQLTQSVVFGKPFVAIGMGNRQGTQGIPQGTPVFGSTLCGVLDAQYDSMLAFVPTINPTQPSANTNFYFINQSSVPRPGQMVPYQSPSGLSIPGLVTDYSVTGQKSASGVAIQSSYIALGTQQMQVIYGFGYSYATNKMLEELKGSVNVISNAEGHIQLVQEVDKRSESAINIPPKSIGNYLVGFTQPTPTVMYKIPPMAVADQFYANDTTQYNVGGGNKMSAIELFNNTVFTFGAGTYVDYSNGAIYEVKQSDSNYLYPNGYSIGAQGLNLIRKQFREAQVQPGTLTLISQTDLDVEIEKDTATLKTPPTAPQSTEEYAVNQSSGSQAPPAPSSASTRQGPPPSPSSIKKSPPPAPSSSGRSGSVAQFHLPQQPFNVALVDLKNKFLAFTNKFFSQSIIA